MSNVSKNSDLKFEFYRPNRNDRTDPGFRILGHKLRWVAANQTEDKSGRVWRVLRRSSIPDAVVQKLKDSGRELFNGDETIRLRELVLAYAPIEAVTEERKILAEAAARQMNLVRSKAVPGGAKGLKVSESEMTQVSGERLFED